MRIEATRDIDRLFSEGTPIDEAVEQAAREARRRHRLAGTPMVVYRDGRIVKVPADQLDAEEGREHGR